MSEAQTPDEYVERAEGYANAASAMAQRDDQLVLLAWAQFNMLRAIEDHLGWLSSEVRNG